MGDERKRTPQLKGSSNVSKFRTPTNLNTTVSGARNGVSAGPSRGGSASKLPAKPSMNLDVTTRCPTIKSNLGTSIATVDHELECDLVYNEYLQALMRKEIILKAIEKQEQDVTDQMSVKQDNLHKFRMAFEKIKREVTSMEKLHEINKLLDNMQDNFDKFLQLSASCDLEDTLGVLFSVLEEFCNKVHLKNIKSITEQEDLDKLAEVIENCRVVTEKIKTSERNIEQVNKLGGLMKKFQELSVSVEAKQKSLNEMQKNESYKLLKFMSDGYAKKEKYEDC